MSTPIDPRCVAMSGLVAEFVLGTLDGAERARLVEHLDACVACRHEVDAAALVVNDLSLLAGEAEPTDGFTDRALDAMFAAVPPTEAAPVTSVAPLAPSRRRTRHRVLAGAVALVGAAAITVGVVVVSRDDRAPVTTRAAMMVSSRGYNIGQTVLTRTDPPRLSVTVTYPLADATYVLQGRDAAGRWTDIGPLHRAGTSWSWSGPVAGVATGQVQLLRVIDGDGNIACEGEIPS